MKKIFIFDSTLRDGEQSPGATLSSQGKFQIASQLAKLGVDIIEAGFPIASEDDANAVKTISEQIKGPSICALARCKKEDMETALKSFEKAQKPRLHLVLATSEIHRKYKLDKTKSEIIKMAKESVHYAKKYISEVEFSPEDATRTEKDFLLEVCQAVANEGADIINIADTVGYSTPEEFGALINFLRHNIDEKIIISVHCHNDLGLAVANSLSGLKNGATQVECTINGIGERAGNASLEEIVMNLIVRKEYFGFQTGIKTEEIYRTSKLVSSLTGIMVQPNKAIVGENAFRHESGIHQDGILKYKGTYEIINPQMIGVPESELVLGKHSGRHALQNNLKQLGFNVGEDKIDKIFERFKQLADKKKDITDIDLIVIAEEETVSAISVYTLEYFHIISDTLTKPIATVRLKKGENLFEKTSSGDGPVDAIYKTIDIITGCSPVLKEYKINAVTGGKDAQGEAIISLIIDNTHFVGKGISTDIIEASAKAYLNAINMYFSKKNVLKKITL